MDSFDLERERGITILAKDLDAPGVEAYERMVVGENQRPGDLSVNVCKKRHVSSVRRSSMLCARNSSQRAAPRIYLCEWAARSP